MHKIVDSYNRHINYLRISVTDRCNLRCVYCMPAGGIPLLSHNEILSFEEITRIARIASRTGISKIRITGGEPLVRKGITSLIEQLQAIPGINDLSITTNGILLESHADALKKAGLRRINISLDSLDAEKYKKITRGGDIHAVLRGINKAQDAGFNPIKINVVVMRGVNDDELCSFAELSMQHNAHIRFIEFMPVDEKSIWGKDLYISNDELKTGLSRMGELVPVEPDVGSGPAVMYRLKGAPGLIGLISPLSNHFCATCNRLRLTADGKLRACLFSDDETDIKTPLRTGCTDSRLQDIITQVILSKPRRHTVMEPSFKKCKKGMSAIGG